MTGFEREALRFSGPCSIVTIERHRQDLLRALADEASIVVDLSGVDAVDASFVQLIVSAARTVAKRNGSIEVVNVPDAVAASFRGAGIDVGRLSPVASGR